MDVVWWFVWSFIWLALAFWPARVAARKGHNPVLFFFFSLLVFPVALVVAYIIPANRARMA